MKFGKSNRFFNFPKKFIIDGNGHEEQDNGECKCTGGHN